MCVLHLFLIKEYKSLTNNNKAFYNFILYMSSQDENLQFLPFFKKNLPLFVEHIAGYLVLKVKTFQSTVTQQKPEGLH